MQKKSLQSPHHVEYKSNFLKNVIFRLDFNKLPQLESNDIPELGRLISEKYSDSTQKAIKNLQVSISDDGTKTIQEETCWIWQYWQKTYSNRSMSLLKDALIFECHESGYKNFLAFKEDINFVFSKFLEIYDVSQFNRMGLRYINEIFIPENRNPLKWDGYINSNLCKAIEAGVIDSSVPVRSMHQVQVKQNDIDVLFNYGIFNRDYPNPIARPELILDYDYYMSGALDKNEVLDKLSNLNSASRLMFESSIEDKLRDRMGIVE